MIFRSFKLLFLVEKYSTQLETLQNVAIETDELISDVVKSQKLTSRGKNEKSLYI